MQAVLKADPAPSGSRDALDAAPLYVASLFVTLAGVGAVGVTLNDPNWSPIWVTLTLLGHVVSLLLRRARIRAEGIFFPVMLVGGVVVVQLVQSGGRLPGLEAPLSEMQLDLATAVFIATLAVLRTFTLVNNSSLLFSPVPAITMLALIGSSNPNAEVPLFFGLLVLGSLFAASYEAHLRRIARTQRPASPLLFHLLPAWCVTMLVAVVALSFPLLVQPAVGPLSPFALPGIQRLQSLVSFAQSNASQAPVGQGPISLSPTPVCKIYTRAAGNLFRTGVLSNYTGRGWTMERPPNVTDFRSDERAAPLQADDTEGIVNRRDSYIFRFPPDPDRTKQAPTRLARQRIVYEGAGADAFPALGRIRQIRANRGRVSLHVSGNVTAGTRLTEGAVAEIVSEVAEPEPDALRQAPPVDADGFAEPEMLSLPQSTYPVQAIAREETQGLTNAYDRMEALVAYVEKTCRYTLMEEPTPQGEDAAVYYLTRSRRGACDLSATAVAVMARAVGVPARVAVGYVGDEALPGGGGWQIRQAHLHMWVEAFFPGYGWIDFNPAPPLVSIREDPILVIWDRIRSLFARIGGGGLDALLLVAVVLLTAALAAYGAWVQFDNWWTARKEEERTLRSSPAAAVRVHYGRAVRALGRLGWPREGWMTAREYLSSVREAAASLPDPCRAAAGLAALEKLTVLFEQAAYAGEASAEAPREAEELARAARLLPRRLLPKNAPPAWKIAWRALLGKGHA